MQRKNKNESVSGITGIILFIIWTILILTADVRPLGVNKTEIGLAGINIWFHSLTGTNMTLYTITDWLGLVPVFVCMIFAFTGLFQLIKRKSLIKVDADILALGIYYVIVIAGYLIFEMIPINYRPVLINGHMEASYPSSTTLLVLSVMPTLVFQSGRRLKNVRIKRLIAVSSAIFSAFMVVGRLISGVHWLTDIVGSVFFSAGLYYLYKSAVIIADKK